MAILSGIFKPNFEKLTQSGDIRALDRLLEHKDAELRLEAVSALCRIGSPETLDPLIRASRDSDLRIRDQAIAGLGRRVEPAAAEALAAALTDPCWKCRENAARFLILLGRVDTVTGMLNHQDKEIKKSAIRMLGQSGSEAAVGPLVRSLVQPGTPADLQNALIDALRGFSQQAARDAVAGWEERQRAERIRALPYRVGSHLVGKGQAAEAIGTEIVGDFDPLKVIFSFFDIEGRRLSIRGQKAINLIWPPLCVSDREKEAFKAAAIAVARAIGSAPSQDNFFMTLGDPLGDTGKLIVGLQGVAVGAVGKHLRETTVLPFLQRYAVDELHLNAEELEEEILLNALMNFLCTRVLRPGEEITLKELTRRAREVATQT